MFAIKLQLTSICMLKTLFNCKFIMVINFVHFFVLKIAMGKPEVVGEATEITASAAELHLILRSLSCEVLFYVLFYIFSIIDSTVFKRLFSAIHRCGCVWMGVCVCVCEYA